MTNKDIIIPSNVTMIYAYAFRNREQMISVTIPSSITSIGNSAFYYCDRLLSITYQGTKEQWNSISKGSSWDYNTGSYTIRCTDGDIAK